MLTSIGNVKTLSLSYRNRRYDSMRMFVSIAGFWGWLSFVHSFSIPSYPLRRTTTTATRRRTTPMFLFPETIGSMYTTCLDQQPVLTQSLTAGVFAVCGDGIAQSIDHHRQQRSKQQQQLEQSISATGTTAESTTNSLWNDHSYDPTRGLHYFVKGLGSGVLWSGWYSISDTTAMQVWEPFLENDAWWSMATTTIMTMVQSNGDQETFHLVYPNPNVLRIITCIILEQVLVCPIMYALWDIPVPALLRGSPVRQIPQQIQTKLPPLLWANFQVWTPVNIITYQLPAEYRVLFASMADLLWQTINSRITGQEIPIRIPESSSMAINNNNNNNNDDNYSNDERILEPIRTATTSTSSTQQVSPVSSSTARTGSKSLQPQKETV
jgi:hypothetical protein